MGLHKKSELPGKTWLRLSQQIILDDDKNCNVECSLWTPICVTSLLTLGDSAVCKVPSI
jgi:hypothetical protein